MKEMQMAEANSLSLVEQAWVERINQRSRELFLTCHSESVLMHDPTFPKPLKGRNALGKWFDELFSMFPDYQVKMVRSFGQEGWVCLETEESGTMKGPIHAGERSVPPTGKSFKIPSSIICKVENGSITEIRVYYDVLGLMTQLGLGP